jgi:hypothetical protein
MLSNLPSAVCWWISRFHCGHQQFWVSGRGRPSLWNRPVILTRQSYILYSSWITNCIGVRETMERRFWQPPCEHVHHFIWSYEGKQTVKGVQFPESTSLSLCAITPDPRWSCFRLWYSILRMSRFCCSTAISSERPLARK